MLENGNSHQRIVTLSRTCYIGIQFEITDPDGLHQAQLLTSHAQKWAPLFVYGIVNTGKLKNSATMVGHKVTTEYVSNRNVVLYAPFTMIDSDCLQGPDGKLFPFQSLKGIIHIWDTRILNPYQFLT